MKIQIKHVMLVFLGAAMPTLFHTLEGQSAFTWAVIAQDLVSAAVVGISAAMPGIFPNVTTSN